MRLPPELPPSKHLSFCVNLNRLSEPMESVAQHRRPTPELTENDLVLLTQRTLHFRDAALAPAPACDCSVGHTYSGDPRRTSDDRLGGSVHSIRSTTHRSGTKTNEAASDRAWAMSYLSRVSRRSMPRCSLRETRSFDKHRLWQWDARARCGNECGEADVRFWGKEQRRGSELDGDYHPAACHCIDVAASARALVSTNILLGSRLAEALGIPDCDTATPQSHVQ
jgi:hypothetical protein